MEEHVTGLVLQMGSATTPVVENNPFVDQPELTVREIKRASDGWYEVFATQHPEGQPFCRINPAFVIMVLHHRPPKAGQGQDLYEAALDIIRGTKKSRTE